MLLLYVQINPHSRKESKSKRWWRKINSNHSETIQKPQLENNSNAEAISRTQQRYHLERRTFL
jgi:hypothetical protein